MAWLRVQCLLASIGAAFVLAGCASHPSSTVCKTGIVCPSPLQCAAVQSICIENNCGNGIVDVGEDCDDGNVMDGDGCSHDCRKEQCGNGRQDPGEECDDGNLTAGDGCSPSCQIERCGNGHIDPGEVCDDGNNVDGDGCSGNCKSNETCGNCVVDTSVGEVCDDCNTVNGDSCESDCKSGAGCGNGVHDPGEECDDGNKSDTDDCLSSGTTAGTTCKINVCGDGITDTTGNHLQPCDDGVNGVPTQTQNCNIDCTVPSCGDGQVNAAYTPPGAPGPEQCDNAGANADSADCTSQCQVNVCGDGHPDTSGPGHIEQCDTGGNSATCNADCTMPACGDGKVNPQFTPTGAPGPEQCDDGNNVDGDGCSSTCQLEHCGNGHVDPGEQCDPPGTAVGGLQCSASCQLEQCGNGILDPGEECDDGNTSDTDDCLSSNPDPATCKKATCGDGKIDMFREECDDGASNGMLGDGCSVSCHTVSCGDGVVEQGEQCDAGAGNNGNNKDCTASCQVNFCGDSHPDTQGTAHMETCDTGGNSQSCNADCTSPRCGDGKVNPSFTPTGAPGPEQCDDGNTTSGDGCSSNCQLEHCGNGHLDPGEGCDDGNNVGGDGCSASCQVEQCGNGILDPGEACDDGNTSDTDDCLSSGTNAATTCKKATCGDGKTDVFREQCDDGANNGKVGDPCSATCHLVSCGNSLIEQGEQCDDGTGNNADDKDCTSTCQANFCGDGHPDTLGTNKETCDTGGNSQTCNADCTTARCGDGKVNPSFTPTGAPGPEQCDDGNTTNGDGCSSTCQLEHCGNGHLDAGEGCDDGNNVAGDGCSPSCQVEQCGNGILDQGEECDDGNSVATDDCVSNNTAPATCKIAVCGDSIVDTLREDCDDGANNGKTGDPCDANCKFVTCGNGTVDTGEVCDDRNTDLDACGTCLNDCQRAVTASQATGVIVTVDGTTVKANQTFTLDDGFHTAITYEFSTTVVSDTLIGSNYSIQYNTTDSADQVATKVASEINTRHTALSSYIKATTSGNFVSLVHDKKSSLGNVDIKNSANAPPDWGTFGMSGGAAGDCASGVGCNAGDDCQSGTCTSHKCM